MNRIVRGTLFSVAMRWTERLLGLLSMLLLARLLLPQDFGIIAMASLVISLVDLLLDLSVRATLVQEHTPSQAQFDTAWTLGLLQAALVALVLLLLAPLAARYFHEPRVADVVRVLALGLLASGAENIGVVQFQKQLQFGREYQLLLWRRLCGFGVTLAAAWWLRSYWALVLGTLAARLCGLVCSYALHPMRPRLTLRCWREILGVSKWLLARTSACFFEGQLHRAVVARHNSAAVMGAYSMATEISTLPSTELLMPISRVLFPAFVEARPHPQELKRLFLQAQGVQCLLALPASAGLAVVAPQLVPLLLGPQWGAAVPLVQTLALAYLAGALLYSSTSLCIALQQVRVLALFIWSQVALFAMLAFTLTPAGQAQDIAWLRLGVGLASDIGLLLLLLRVFPPLRLRDMLAGLQRPLLASACMAAGLWLLAAHWPWALPRSEPTAGAAALAIASQSSGAMHGAVGGNPYALLLSQLLAGVLLYAACVYLLWRGAGRPDGAEAFVLGLLRQGLQRIGRCHARSGAQPVPDAPPARPAGQVQDPQGPAHQGPACS